MCVCVCVLVTQSCPNLCDPMDCSPPMEFSDGTTLTSESEKELNSLVMRVKEESGTAGLKLNIQKTKIIASSPITSWQIDGENVEAVKDFIFLGCKITVVVNAAMEIKDSCSLEGSLIAQLVKNLPAM